jgi:hypothetical protein
MIIFSSLEAANRCGLVVWGVQVNAFHADFSHINSFVADTFPWTALTIKKRHTQLMSYSLATHDLYCLLWNQELELIHARNGCLLINIKDTANKLKPPGEVTRTSITIYNFEILVASVLQFYQVSSNTYMLKLNHFSNFKIPHICHIIYMNNVSTSH